MDNFLPPTLDLKSLLKLLVLVHIQNKRNDFIILVQAVYIESYLNMHLKSFHWVGHHANVYLYQTV